MAKSKTIWRAFLMFCSLCQITTTSRIFFSFVENQFSKLYFNVVPRSLPRSLRITHPWCNHCFEKPLWPFQKAVGYHLVHIIINAGTAKVFWQLNNKKVWRFDKNEEIQFWRFVFYLFVHIKLILCRVDRFPKVCHEHDEF